MLGDVVDGEWASVDEQDDGGRSGIDYGFDEVVLRAEEVEGVAIATVVL